MKTAALIVTTGLPNISGVAALMPEVGAISAGQRMISAFQCAGVTLVGLVIGPENKKSERQFSQNGVVFLRCEEEKADFFQGMKLDFPSSGANLTGYSLFPATHRCFCPKPSKPCSAAPQTSLFRKISMLTAIRYCWIKKPRM